MPGRVVSAAAWTDLDAIDIPPVDDIYIIVATASSKQLSPGIYRIERTQLETIVGPIGAERRIENQTQNEQLRNLLADTGTVENMPKKFAPENLMEQKHAHN